MKTPESFRTQASSSSGAERDRTVGLLNAIQALSQLSYSPTTEGAQNSTCPRCPSILVVFAASEPGRSLPRHAEGSLEGDPGPLHVGLEEEELAWAKLDVFAVARESDAALDDCVELLLTAEGDFLVRDDDLLARLAVAGIDAERLDAEVLPHRVPAGRVALVVGPVLPVVGPGGEPDRRDLVDPAGAPALSRHTARLRA